MAAPASEAGVNSSLTDRALRVETTPFPHLKQWGGIQIQAGIFGTRLQEDMGIPIPSLLGFIERHGILLHICALEMIAPSLAPLLTVC